jgi:hypothetical protein
MPDITTQIKAAIGDEPPLGFGPTDVIATARRVRRRRGRYAAATLGVAAAAVTVGTVGVLPGGGAGGAPAAHTLDGHATTLSLTALSRIAGRQPAAVPGVPSSARVDLRAGQLAATTRRT